MTRASAARIARRRRRYNDDDDLLVAELAIAFHRAWGLSQRTAIDHALALQGKLGSPSKIPRGAKAGTLVGFTLADRQSFHARNRDIRRKLETGKLTPDARVVEAMTQLLLIRLREDVSLLQNRNS
jgi:hypothetical protein